MSRYMRTPHQLHFKLFFFNVANEQLKMLSIKLWRLPWRSVLWSFFIAPFLIGLACDWIGHDCGWWITKVANIFHCKAIFSYSCNLFTETLANSSARTIVLLSYSKSTVCVVFLMDISYLSVISVNLHLYSAPGYCVEIHFDIHQVFKQ